MTEYSKEDALAYLEATRLMFEGKVGFAHFTEKLAGLEAYIRKTAEENESLHAFLDEQGLTQSFDEFNRAHT